jgi:asparagine synthase (glutamine-hydrolysing)
MCGITGLWNLDGKPINASLLEKMNNTMVHRGPDDEGYLLVNTTNKKVSPCCGADSIEAKKKKFPFLKNLSDANDLGFGFRRLSIIDLSENGHQPMSTGAGRYWIVFNGEIYNYIELREELKGLGYHFQTQTDTEVILNAYLKWGEECLNHFNGMWAFALFDSTEKRLFISRDRFGIKPLYYIYRPGEIFAFASEIKALLPLLNQFKPDMNSVFDYFAMGLTCHKENTFFEGLKQLMPASKMVVRQGQIEINKYYKVPFSKTKLSFDEAKEKFKYLLLDAIKLRQRSDVPFGYALSGGIDSSSIVCGAASMKDINSDITFSLVYPGKAVDESDYIKAVVDKTCFNSRFVSAEGCDLAEDFERFVYHQEEPFVGLSYFGEYKLRQLIRENKVTVSLEGQGADEIVSGYNVLLPYYFQDLASRLMIKQFKNELYNFDFLSRYSFSSAIKDWLKPIIKYEGTLVTGVLKKYPYLDVSLLNAKPETDHNNRPTLFQSRLNHALHYMLTCSSIPEQLIRADKSAMAFSVEARFPFLDYRLVEFAGSLPYHYKISNGFTKRVLREAMKGLIPDSIYQRRDKIGFAVPMDNWITDELWAILMSQLEQTSIGFLNKIKFQEVYTSPVQVDYKFWKTISLVLWWNAFEKVCNS